MKHLENRKALTVVTSQSRNSGFQAWLSTERQAQTLGSDKPEFASWFCMILSNSVTSLSLAFFNFFTCRLGIKMSYS